MKRFSHSRTRVLLALFLLLSPTAWAGDDPLAGPRRLYHERQHVKAEEALLGHLVAHRDDVEAMKLLAEVYLRMERPGDAERIARKAAAVAPDDPEVVVTLWEAELAKSGWTKEARDVLEKKIHVHLAAGEPDRRRLMTGFLGYGLLPRSKNKTRMRERLLAATVDDPPEEAEGDLMEAVIITKELTPRVALIRQFLALYPGSKQANYMREIWLTMVREDRTRLFRTATTMLQKDPGNRRVRAAFARWLLETEPPDPERALFQLEKALPLLDHPEEIDRPELMSDEEWKRDLDRLRGKYLASIGHAQQLLGRNEAAVETLLRAATHLSHDVGLNLALGDAYAALGNDDLAMKAWERSCESGPSPTAENRIAEVRSLQSFGLLEGLRFTDITKDAGLVGAGGSRIAAGDVNGDGWPDLVFGGVRLFLNDGDGTFTKAVMPGIKGAQGGLLADLDNDGDRDLFVFRNVHPILLENDGKGGFTDRTPDNMQEPGAHRTQSAAVLDFDGDGRLDLYLANYEKPPTPPYARGTFDRLWRNLGGFEFEDATKALGNISAEPMCGRGCATADFDDDGDTDLYIANYRLDPDYLYVNDGKGGLVNRAAALGVRGDCEEGYFGHGIGVTFGDLNGDGRLDIVVGNLAHPRYIGFSDVTRIFLNTGKGFTDSFLTSGVRFEETHSNPSLGDVDLDGDLDLFLTSVYRGRWSFLYLNDGNATFTDVTWRTGTRIDNGWGSIFCDVDMDGDPDLVVKTSKGMKLLRNDRREGNHLGLTLVGRTGNGGAIGARVTLTGDGMKQVREVSGGSGTGCQDDPSIRFGVGAMKGPFTLTVRWPGGKTQRILGVEPGNIYRLVEGANLETVK